MPDSSETRLCPLCRALLSRPGALPSHSTVTRAAYRHGGSREPGAGCRVPGSGHRAPGAGRQSGMPGAVARSLVRITAVLCTAAWN
ncbi:hypothetical protein FF041_32110 [Streptomyces jumonjinensis]|uniref:Uncharacterized protein n=1 Tax=Streptomyces jumonjinensis TaxID=1945 RepID=A0A646KQY4_STRJU|nr:hypothetical protein [Streptomyces jumonjinensis]